jgi:DnaK suppressor protein
MATMSENKRTERLRRMLIGRREDLRERVRKLRRSQNQESLSTPGDAMDIAKSLADVEAHGNFIERAENQLLQIEDALARAQEGQYGICSGCGEDIPDERLKAVPSAMYCVDCQSKLSANEPRSRTD